ncbi:ligand-gated channel [Sphingobium sp. TA15]|nr:ligand-gated channel [Sphingobium sp. TA15]
MKTQSHYELKSWEAVQIHRRLAGSLAGKSAAGGLKLCLVTSAAMLALTPNLATAQTVTGVQDGATSPAGLEDIVVTANRRSERAQDVPMAISTMSNAALEQRGVASTTDLQQVVPSLTFNYPVNVGSPYIRGVGSELIDPTSESPVALYVDDVYVAAPQTSLFKLTSIQQIDVLSGPQGTLFGRNSTGGVVQIRTLDPSHDLTFNASVTYGNYDMLSIPLYVSTSLTDNVAADLSVLYENQGRGYGRNLVNGFETFKQADNNISLRSKWLISLGDKTTIRIAADYANLINTNAYQKPQGTISPISGDGYPGRYNANGDQIDRSKLETGGVSATIDQQVGDLDLTSITAYRKVKANLKLDDDVSPIAALNLELFENYRSFSQEVRLKNSGKSRLKWVVGAFYYDSKGGYEPFLVNGAAAIPKDAQQTTSVAAFGQATFAVTPTVNLTGGLRYTYEKQTFTFPAGSLQDDQSVNRLTFRIAIDKHLTPDVLAYASFNRGFKSGGYNLISPGNAFKPENLDSYEGGIKSELFDRSVRINLGGFYYDYSNQQYLLPVLGGNIVVNAAASKIWGIEGKLEVIPLSGLSLSTAFTVMHGRYSNYPGAVRTDQDGNASPPFNARGNHTVNTPDFVISGSASYSFDTSFGHIDADLSGQYNGGYYFTVDNRLEQPSYFLLNAGLAWSPENSPLRVRVWAKNLTDARYYQTKLSIGNPVGDAQRQADPRTYGVTLSIKF